MSLACSDGFLITSPPDLVEVGVECEVEATCYTVPVSEPVVEWLVLAFSLCHCMQVDLVVNHVPLWRNE